MSPTVGRSFETQGSFSPPRGHKDASPRVLVRRQRLGNILCLTPNAVPTLKGMFPQSVALVGNAVPILAHTGRSAKPFVSQKRHHDLQHIIVQMVHNRDTVLVPCRRRRRRRRWASTNLLVVFEVAVDHMGIVVAQKHRVWVRWGHVRSHSLMGVSQRLRSRKWPTRQGGGGRRAGCGS